MCSPYAVTGYKHGTAVNNKDNMGTALQSCESEFKTSKQ